MNGLYTLCGFSSGGAKAPQFIEPVFQNDQRLYVQSSNNSDDTVMELIEFHDDIEFLDEFSQDSILPGQKRIFAIRDIGDRIICGGRDHVSRYLKHNLRNYIDKPYFLREACQFTNEVIPEAFLLSTEKDLLETAAVASSIRRFCVDELRFPKPERSTFPVLLGFYLTEPQSKFPIRDILQSDSEDLFERWILFTKKDSPRIYDSRWSTISKTYLDIFKGDRNRGLKYRYFYWLAARHVLSTAIRRTYSGSFDSLFNTKIEKSIKLSYNNYIESEGKGNISLLVKGNGQSIFRRIISVASKGIQQSLMTNRATVVDLSMHVLFISLVIKFSYDLDRKHSDK